METVFTPAKVILVAAVVIRSITDLQTLRAVEDLQQSVWRMPDRDVVPTHQLVAATTTGGMVLGAFAPGGDLIGFCYGFVGLREGRSLLYSHMAGVAEGWRGRGVGFLLKQAQREAALACGLDRIVWTFDPLRAGNAHFNLRKLGAEAGVYYVNYYGEMPDHLNRGLESDRLEADWRLRAPRVARAMGGQGATAGKPHAAQGVSQAAAAPLALAASGDPPRPDDPAELPDAPFVRVAVPGDFSAMRSRDGSLGREWREATRRVFLAYFERGYAAVDFHRATPAGFYVLQVQSGGTPHAP